MDLQKEIISYKTKTWLVVASSALLAFVLVFTITNKIVNADAGVVVQTPDVEIKTYTPYSIGDSVKLKDDSNWHVLYDSSDKSSYVTLLSDYDIDTDVEYKELEDYLAKDYKEKVETILNASSEDVLEVRMLAYIDLAALTDEDSSTFLPNTSIKKLNIPEFVYSETTVTDTIYTVGGESKPMMICAESNPTFCTGTMKKNKVRPVLVIEKEYLK